MNINSLTSAHLKRAIGLLDKKESLEAQLAEIDQQLASLLDGNAAPAAASSSSRKAAPAAPQAQAAKGGRAPKTRGRGALKASILAELRAAGSDGVSVQALAKKLKSKPANLHAWFNMTGKNVPGLKKIGRGEYSLTE